MLLSANRHLADAKRCRKLGVKQCLTKPIGQSEVLDAILRVHTERRREQLIEARSPSLRKPRLGNSISCSPKTIR